MAKHPDEGGGTTAPQPSAGATAELAPVIPPPSNGLMAFPIFVEHFAAKDGYEGLWADFRCNISLFDLERVGADARDGMARVINDWNYADPVTGGKLEITAEGMKKVPSPLVNQMVRFWNQEICKVPPDGAGDSSTDSPAETPEDQTSTSA